MEAQDGIQFLILLLKDQRYPMDTQDLEAAIKIASRRQPTGAFKEAARHYAARHGSCVASGYLGFAKGTRWLAVLRRDEGEQAFEEICQKLKEVMK